MISPRYVLGIAISPLSPPFLGQSSSATLPRLSRPRSRSRHLAGSHERQAFDHCCGRVAKLALERLRVQRRCPRAPTPEPGKGHRPMNRRSKSVERVCPGVLSFPCPGLPVPGLSWFRVAVSPAPAPSGSCSCLFHLVFLFSGRGRHVPAPSGRDVGSSAWAPTQEPALSGILIRLLSWRWFFIVYFILLWALPCWARVTIPASSWQSSQVPLPFSSSMGCSQTRGSLWSAACSCSSVSRKLSVRTTWWYASCIVEASRMPGCV